MWAVHHAILDFINDNTLAGGERVTYRNSEKVNRSPIKFDYTFADVDNSHFENVEDEGLKNLVIRMMLIGDKGNQGEDYNYLRWLFLDYHIRLHKFLRENEFAMSQLSVEMSLFDEKEVEVHCIYRVRLLDGLGIYQTTKDGTDLKVS